jgi:Holliday junction resolvasome RuvABC DNA-binding subunit
MSILFSRSNYKVTLDKIHNRLASDILRNVDETEDTIITKTTGTADNIKEDTISALCVLGYSKTESVKYTNDAIDAGFKSSQEIIKYVLKQTKLKLHGNKK